MTLKNEALIRAALDGKRIQCRQTGSSRPWSEYGTQQGAIGALATEDTYYEFRLAPPPEKVVYRCFSSTTSTVGLLRAGGWTSDGVFKDHATVQVWPGDQFKLTYDGETGKLKSVEIV